MSLADLTGLFLSFLLIMGTLIIVGMYFRGPNWGFVLPWEPQ